MDNKSVSSMKDGRKSSDSSIISGFPIIALSEERNREKNYLFSDTINNFNLFRNICRDTLNSLMLSVLYPYIWTSISRKSDQSKKFQIHEIGHRTSSNQAPRL